MHCSWKNTGGRCHPFNAGICDLLEQVLKFNNFQFNSKGYLQVGGTAMGTKVAPSLATISMADFEEKHVYSKEKGPLQWLQFLANIFGIWEGSEESLQKFMDELNEIHPSIKFT